MSAASALSALSTVATDRRMAALTVAVCGLGAVYGIVFDFLGAEDANVLFNRANNLQSGAPFHYGGYLSIPPQLLAQALAGLAPLTQAAAYSLAAMAVMLAMLRYLARTGGGEGLALAVALFYLALSPLFMHNLTYALWPAALLIMLIGHVASLERRRLHPLEMALIVALAGFSPLSALSAAPFLLRVARGRDWRDWSVLVLLVLTAFVLPDRSVEGARAEGLISGFLRHLALCAADPLACFGGRPGLIPLPPVMVASYLAALAVAVGAAAAALRALAPGPRRDEALALLAFLAGPLAILAVSFASVPPPIGVRHLFPCVVAAGVGIAAIAGSRAPRLFVVLAALLALPASAALVARAVINLPEKVAAFRLLAAPPAGDVIIFRERNGKIWSVILSDRRWEEADCRPDLPDIVAQPEAYEAAIAGAAAIIYCSSRLGSVVVAPDGFTESPPRTGRNAP